MHLHINTTERAALIATTNNTMMLTIAVIIVVVVAVVDFLDNDNNINDNVRIIISTIMKIMIHW